MSLAGSVKEEPETIVTDERGGGLFGATLGGMLAFVIASSVVAGPLGFVISVVTCAVIAGSTFLYIRRNNRHIPMPDDDTLREQIKRELEIDQIVKELDKELGLEPTTSEQPSFPRSQYFR